MPDKKKNDAAKTDDVKDATKAPRAPAQSLIDQERGDWEGMGQARHQPETPPSSPAVGKPTPGAGSLAGEPRAAGSPPLSTSSRTRTRSS